MEFRAMTQFAVRIASILLICVAATPVVAGPRGGAYFAGGGVHLVLAEARLRPRILQPLASQHLIFPRLVARVN